MKHTDERGSMVPMFGGLLFVAFLVIALVVELAMLGATYRSVAGAADAAAEAGAAMISEPDAYRSELALDPVRSVVEAERVAYVLAGSDASVLARFQGVELCVTVGRDYRPATLALLGLGDVWVEVASCAEPRVG